MRKMYESGRIGVCDAPQGTVAAQRLKHSGGVDFPPYKELLEYLGANCNGFTGASLAGVVRAAASRALERAVCDFASELSQSNESGIHTETVSISNCIVTQKDFEGAISDVSENSSDADDTVKLVSDSKEVKEDNVIISNQPLI